MNPRRVFACLAFVQALSITITMASEKRSWIGFIVDKDTAQKISANPKGAKLVLSAYRKNEALQPSAQKNGYGLFVDDHLLYLDSQGNKLAVSTIKESAAKSGFYVSVQGVQKGDSIAVNSIREIDQSPVFEVK